MARARLIKPGFFTNDELAEVDVFGRLLFIGLWTIADREGRLEDRPKRIKAEVMPFDNVDVDALLEQLASGGFITRYTVDGLRLIQVEAFTKHQNPHFRETESLLPARGFSPTDEPKALGQPEALVPSIDTEPSASPSLDRAEAVPSPAVAVAVTSSGSGECEGASAAHPSKPLPLPKKTTPTEEWAAEQREKFRGRLRDFDETLRFHMNGSYYRTCADKCTFLEKKLEAAAEREAEKYAPKGGNGNGRTGTRAISDVERADRAATDAYIRELQAAE